MPPNPIAVQQQNNSKQKSNKNLSSHLEQPAVEQHAAGLIPSISATSAVVLLVIALPWARHWLLSGAALESLLIVYGYSIGSRIFPFIPLWTLLATLNLVYAVCSTSWLLNAVFAAACYPALGLTCLFQFVWVANLARRSLRRTLRQLHFTRDKIAFFNLPALEIDTEVDGLLVIRGVTVILSSLTLVVHGIELGLKLADDIELSMYADQVTVSLFRRIEIGDVFGNIKGGALEMTFGEVDAADTESLGDASSFEETVFIENTPLLRAATAGSQGFKSRPSLRKSFTGVSFMQDSSAQDGLDIVTALSPDDEKAEKQYREMRNDIALTSAVYQSRRALRKRDDFHLESDNEIRAAICAELHGMPSVIHPPQRSIRVTTLQNLPPPKVRRFLHRLPFLLRLLLAPLSYFHPITIDSINCAGSGRWLSTLLRSKIFKQYTATNGELRRLERRISTWLADANFCLQLADIEGLGQVPISSAFDILAYLHFSDVMAYRTVPASAAIAQVVRLGGADATFKLPSFLLPHHEHIVPPVPTPEHHAALKVAVEDADGGPKTIQAEHERQAALKDETQIHLSVHASLPATLDQSLLNFVAALVKATKMIEFEKETDSDNEEPEPTDPPLPDPNAPLSPTSTFSDASSTTSSTSRRARLNSLARSIRTNLKDSTAATGASLRDLAHSTREGVKKAVVGGMVNDRWIAKLVGKIAANLQHAQGDLGYSGEIPVPLAPYREGEKNWEPKLLP